MRCAMMIFILIFSISVHADEPKIERFYKSHDIAGALLIESEDGQVAYEYNINDTESFSPASTFKIPHTLILLEEGLIKAQDETIAWDGVKRSYAPWNQDQTLKTAFQYSCVWCYQRYALKLNKAKYHDYLNKFNYGNRQIGSDITRFWLDGELSVSVRGQIDFIRKVYAEDLPVKKQHVQILKEIMLSDVSEQYKIWSKTGWSGKDGWYVGYLMAGDRVWFFANHIEINKKSDLKFRKQLVIEILKVLNIIQ